MPPGLCPRPDSRLPHIFAGPGGGGLAAHFLDRSPQASEAKASHLCPLQTSTSKATPFQSPISLLGNATCFRLRLTCTNCIRNSTGKYIPKLDSGVVLLIYGRNTAIASHGMSRIHATPMVACDEVKLKDKHYMECSDFMVC